MEKTSIEITDWEKSNIQVFWGEIAPCDHIVQIYEIDRVFINTLEGFAGDGFIKNESVIVIATPEHLDELDRRLRLQGFDVDSLVENDQYIPLDAEECISKFMVDNWPDEVLFENYVNELIARAQKNSQKVRTFGEMVAVLWAQGHNGATVKLENLWHKVHEQKQICIYCAYPKSGFTRNANDSINIICQTHSKVIAGNSHPSTEVYYKVV